MLRVRIRRKFSWWMDFAAFMRALQPLALLEGAECALNAELKAPRNPSNLSGQEALQQTGQILRLVMMQHVTGILNHGNLGLPDKF